MSGFYLLSHAQFQSYQSESGFSLQFKNGLSKQNSALASAVNLRVIPGA